MALQETIENYVGRYVVPSGYYCDVTPHGGISELHIDGEIQTLTNYDSENKIWDKIQANAGQVIFSIGLYKIERYDA